MQKIVVVAICAGIVFSGIPAAFGEGLFTPPVRMEPKDQLVCMIVNVADQPVVIRAAACNYNGCRSTSDKTLSPGGVVQSYYVSDEAGSSDVGYCKFEVEGRVKQVRASACFSFLREGRVIARDCLGAE